MSPEQAMGESEISARSDVYALGVVTYEMLTGDPPFTGSTAQAIVARVVTEKPAPPSRLRETIPQGVEDAVLAALQKLPADRPESAAAFGAMLDGNGRPAHHWKTSVAGRPSDRRTIGTLIGALILALALAAWGWLRPLPSVREALPIRTSIPVPTLGGASTALQRQLAITPDGSTLLTRLSRPMEKIGTMRLALQDSVATVLPGVVTFLADYVISRDGREFIGTVGLSQMFRYPIGGGGGHRLPPEIGVGWAAGIRMAPSGSVIDGVYADRCASATTARSRDRSARGARPGAEPGATRRPDRARHTRGTGLQFGLPARSREQ